MLYYSQYSKLLVLPAITKLRGKGSQNLCNCQAFVSQLFSVAHGAQQLVVVGGAFHAVFDEFHCLDGVAVG